MMEIFQKYKETILYLIFGVLTTLINIATYAFCTRILGVNYYISNIIAWFVAVLFAYITNKFYVFESKSIEYKYVIKEMLSFMSCRVLSGVIELVLMFVMLNLLLINDFIVKVITNIVVIIINFILSKLIVFKNKKIEKIQ
ncbi:GtrA family protein [Metaclostridioides mangenotii]|uniref:Flippase GtrA n=1 Tax=Metaclostridioides mangenotii TaxID=1540 RepID=A0ABS4EDQ2_9FIRM|nr:GtrA family protein [Clostridioides mangenotii]MBP1856068.1 putative flippase GtrA [Clostridioides mangenotii]